ncbi:MAG: FAD-dependent monooxygenase [Actinomycetota bacterium]|nr:FAD-dependent monooxygenase [Actinomycetota bacterium]
MSDEGRPSSVCVVGGGPGGLYAAALLKKSDPRRRVVLFEKNPPDATYGWGVVFSDRTLSSFREADYPTYRDIVDRFVIWDAIDVRVDGEVVRCEGQVFSGITRRVLLSILQDRCRDLGVELGFETEVGPSVADKDFDLVIAADGIHSVFRERLASTLKPSVRSGVSRYIWFGTDRTFDSFTFAFRSTEHGLFQAHAYPFEGTTSTFIVECRPEAWRAAGLDRADEATSIAKCEEIFAEDLRGRSLMSNNSKWSTFPTLRCKRWHDGNIVLLGDAVHTAHFSIGSGTKLAMEDAIALAQSFETNDSLDGALADYELERQPRVAAFQEAARQSQSYFENTHRYSHMPAEQFAFHLLTRSGRVDYRDLRLRDPAFVARVDRLADPSAALLSPPPGFNPLELRGLRLRNRVAVVLAPDDLSIEGRPGVATLEAAEAASLSGAGVVITDVVSTSRAGRITSGSGGIYDDAQERAWSAINERVRQALGTPLALHLGHAGPRGATQPRHLGTDRPLRDDAWRLVAASEMTCPQTGLRAEAMTEADMEDVKRDFLLATRRAERADFGVLGLHMGGGYLLGGFLSQTTNRRTDSYGGSAENRMRFPLEILAEVRSVWPESKPLFVSLDVVDWGREGMRLEEGVAVARALRENGCDVIRVLSGQTSTRPRYDPYWTLHLTDVVRNEASVVAMPGRSLSNVDAVHTAVGAGRADLCAVRLGPA